MTAKNTIACYLIILAIIVSLGIIAGCYIAEKSDNLSIENVDSLKTIEFVDCYGTHTIFPIFVYHDNDRNVTCYTYHDGISCIPDKDLGEKR